jgi:hypothetical protein
MLGAPSNAIKWWAGGRTGNLFMHHLLFDSMNPMIVLNMVVIKYLSQSE